MLTDIVCCLPLICDVRCWTMSTDNITYAVIHSHLIIKVVKARTKIITILVGVIDLTDEENVRVTELHLVDSPEPEGGGNHLSHITTESINTLVSPKEQDACHLVPRIGNRVKVF